MYMSLNVHASQAAATRCTRDDYPCTRGARRRPQPFIVTTLPAKAGSFSGGVRLKAPSEPFDHHCADLVTREGEMTAGTLMPPLTQVLRNRLSAHAGLA